MTQEEWLQECYAVKEMMINYASKFATPISMSSEFGSGVAWGTGNYIIKNGEYHILTNKHVFSDCPAGSLLAHLPVKGGEYVAIVSKPNLIPYPVDAGVSKLPNDCYLADRVISVSQIDKFFYPAEDELVFWTGFPGYKAQRNELTSEVRLKTNLYESELKIDSQSFLTQVARLGQDKFELYDPVKHIAIHYPAMAYSNTSGELRHCANPKGMSGSLLWDTKYVACKREGKKWLPEYAKVCGLIWAAHEHPQEVVIATRIEYVLEALPILS